MSFVRLGELETRSAEGLSGLSFAMFVLPEVVSFEVSGLGKSSKSFSVPLSLSGAP